MKTFLSKTFIFSFVLIAATSCSDNNDLKISVKDSEDFYKFTAHFDADKSEKVQEFINEKITPSHFPEDQDWDMVTILDDKTKFKIKSSDGNLEIRLNKNENSRSSYRRVQSMCEEIKEVIMEK